MALSTEHIVELTHLVELSGTSKPPQLGTLHYRGEEMPVFDLGLLLGTDPTQRQLGTRLIVARWGERMFAIQAEGVLDMVRDRDVDDARQRGYEPLELTTLLPEGAW